MKDFFVAFWGKFLKLLEWLALQLQDWKNWVIFLIVVAVIGCEVWVPFLIGLLTGNKWWFGVAAVCQAFWLAPFTPFLPLSIAITVGIRKIIDKKYNNKDK